MEMVQLLVDGSTVPHEIVPMPRDGSCMFHSIAYAIQGSINMEQTKKIRSDLVEHVAQNWSDYAAWSCDADGNVFNSVEEYRRTMLQPTAYGSFCELRAAGELYPFKFEVYDNGVLQGCFGSEPDPVKRLVFSGHFLSGHYDVCFPVTDVITDDRTHMNGSSSQSISTRGRPKKNRGRPKTTRISRSEQLREASQRYRQNHPEVHRESVARYTEKHPEVHKEAVARYTEKHPEVHKEAVARYTEKHPEVHKEAVARYTEKHPEVHKEAVARYTEKHPEVHREAVSRYTQKHPEVNKAAVARYAQSHPEAHRKAVALYSGQNPHINRESVKKYSEKHPEVNIRSKQRFNLSKTLKYCGDIETITKKATEMIGDRLEGERMIKWVLQARKHLLSNFLKTQEILRNKTISALEAFKILPSDCDLSDKFMALAGESLHRATQEPYFCETAYKPLATEHPIVVDEQGRAIIEGQSEVTSNKEQENSWSCNIYTCLLDDSIMLNLKEAFDFIHLCSPDNFYKIIDKSDKAYDRCLQILNTVKPHFPRIRTIVRQQLYQMTSDCRQIIEIDLSLDEVNLNKLKDLGDPSKSKSHRKYYTAEHNTPELELDEDKIIEKYKSAFTVLKKRCLDTPKHDCISCQRLLCLRDVSSLARLRKPIESEVWTQLENYIKSNNILPSTYICHTCLPKLRSNEMPANCVLNGLYVSVMPEEISKLNEFEKILIQRAKAFQVVSSMIPVGNRNIPNRHKIKKVKGRTFHLPLPLEATLEKLPRPEEPLNRHHELYILVQSSPTKDKVVWQDLVNVNKVYKALEYLKNNNMHYSNIILPHNPDQLLNGLDQELHYEAVDSNKNDIEDENIINSGTNNALDENLNQAVSALLTQITDDNRHDYEHYTIYPLHERRQNATASALYQMLKVNAAPIDNRDKDIDVKCFPDIFVEGKYGQFYLREKKLTSAEFIKSRLTSSHAQFRRNQQYLFYLLNDANIRQISAGIFYKLNVTKQKERLTAENYLEMLQKDQLEGDLTAIFSRLRNTEQYWKKPRGDVVCMTKYYGPATWFLTVSPSEWMWTDLADYIKEINNLGQCNKPVSELVAMDPVATSRFMDIQLKGILDFLTSSDNPLGKISHYFWRREYQTRGLQHFHMMLWVEDAPVLQDSTVDEVADFITKYVTCAIPDKNISPTLHDRVSKYQTHKHNSYCLRKKKTNTGFKMVCRFGFPRPVTEKINIKTVTESVAGRKTLSTNNRLYNLPRKEESQNINDYNPTVLMAWNGNMDIQYVGEKTAVLNYYITKYTTKGEKSNMIDTFDNLNSTKSLASRLYNLGLRALSNRECGILEACDTLLGLPLSGTDPQTTIRWLDVNMLRNRRVKSKKEINNLDPESTDLFYESWVDNYYPQRPQELEAINLYEFARWYDVNSSNSRPVRSKSNVYQISSNKFLKKRDRPYLINHYNYDINKYPEKYYFAILIMFKPWRDLSELKAGKATYTEAFHSIKDSIKDACHYGEQQNEFTANLEKAFEMIEAKILEIESNRQSDGEDEGPDNPLDFQPIEANNAMEEFRQGNEIVTEDEMNKLIGQLNKDQKRVFKNVTDTMCGSEKLRLFISGTGGTGKSFLITTIKKWVQHSLNKNVAVTAPTGIAAFNINGLTIHRLLQLPVEHGGTPKYKPLSDQVLKVLRADLADVILIIIDEVSMISNITLMYIHLRLTEIYDSTDKDDGWFGGKHIILFGDLLQLPPVRENSPFEDLSPTDVKKFLGSLYAPNLWKNLFKYDELTVNMRQKDNSTFVALLNRIRLGVLTKDDRDILSKQLIEFHSNCNENRLKELVNYMSKLPENTVCLLPTRNMCSQLNIAMLNNINGCDIELKAIDEIDCPRFLNKKAREALEKYEEDSSMTAGLEKVIKIKIGARVMLRRNIDVSLGLVNGSIGTVNDVIRAIDNRDSIIKLKISFSHGLEYELERVKTKFEVLSRAYVYREQFPVCIAYAITVHKSQGLSLDSAVLDIGSSVFSCGQSYVALSRVRTLDGIHLINFDPSNIKAQETAIVEYNRLRSMYRKDLNLISYQKNRIRKNVDRGWSLRPDVADVQSSDVSDVKKIKVPPKKTTKRRQPVTKTTKKKVKIM